MQTDRGTQADEECITVLDSASGHDKTLEIVVIVPGFELVDRGPGSKVVLGRGGEAQRHLRRHSPLVRADQLDAGTQLRLDLYAEGRELRRVEQINLVEDDEVGASELVGEDL